MNVALIVLDSLRKDRISPYNRTIEFTPNLQAFADGATTYTNAISQAPWSLPAHGSLFTGLYPWQHGASQRYPYLRRGTRLQTLFNQAGFETVAIHNNEWLLPVTGMTDGFDRVITRAQWSKFLRRLWRIESTSSLRNRIIRLASLVNLKQVLGKTSDLSTEVGAVRSFLRNRGSQPFFLFVNLINAHFPYNPPDEYTPDKASNYRSRPLENGGPVDPTEYEALSELYDAEVSYLDDCFGKLIESLKRAGVYEETLIVVVGDHGELLGEDDIVGHHFSVRDEVIEVPLFIDEPDSHVDVNRELIETRELYYRLAEAAGVTRRDDNRLFSDRACGIYQRPVIYGNRLPAERKQLDTFRYYSVGLEEKQIVTDAGKQTHDREPVVADTTAPSR